MDAKNNILAKANNGIEFVVDDHEPSQSHEDLVRISSSHEQHE